MRHQPPSPRWTVKLMMMMMATGTLWTTVAAQTGHQAPDGLTVATYDVGWGGSVCLLPQVGSHMCFMERARGGGAGRETKLRCC